MKRVMTIIGAIMVVCSTGCEKKMMRTQDENIAHEEFRIHPIGRVVREGGKTLIVLDDKYQNGLLGLEKQKHVHVLYWFDRNDTPEKRAVLQVHPRGDRNNPLTGVFATHSPFRPNLIAISRCEIIAVRENVIEVAEIDAFDNTPVIDLKGDFFDYYRPAQER